MTSNMNQSNPVGKLKDIARLDQETKRTHGWYVRVRYQGKTYSKFFSDRKCGGKNLSLLSALAWRDETEKRVGKIRTDKRILYVSSTITGVVGVTYSEKMNRFGVSWVNPDGNQGKTSVSIRKWGRLVAFRKACEIRERKELERLRG
ncbi:AP2 domain-containing protein [Thermodesulfobacteriota bacterium]